MKDSEFIELLNLYLDHEISAQDAARLEAEVQGNAARRRVYQEYCRIQKGCRMLAQDFAPASAEEPARKVVPFPGARAAQRRNRIFAYAGAVAAAACVAIIALVPGGDEPTPGAADTQIAQTPAVVPVAGNTAIAVNQPAPSSRGIVRGNASALSFDQNVQNGSLVLSAGMQNDPRLAWIEDVRLAPIQMPVPADQLRLATPALQPQPQTYTGGKPLPSDVQWIAFKFQK